MQRGAALRNVGTRGAEEFLQFWLRALSWTKSSFARSNRWNAAIVLSSAPFKSRHVGNTLAPRPTSKVAPTAAATKVYATQAPLFRHRPSHLDSTLPATAPPDGVKTLVRRKTVLGVRSSVAIVFLDCILLVDSFLVDMWSRCARMLYEQ